MVFPRIPTTSDRRRDARQRDQDKIKALEARLLENKQQQIEEVRARLQQLEQPVSNNLEDPQGEDGASVVSDYESLNANPEGGVNEATLSGLALEEGIQRVVTKILTPIIKAHSEKTDSSIESVNRLVRQVERLSLLVADVAETQLKNKELITNLQVRIEDSVTNFRRFTQLSVGDTTLEVRKMEIPQRISTIENQLGDITSKTESVERTLCMDVRPMIREIQEEMNDLVQASRRFGQLESQLNKLSNSLEVTERRIITEFNHIKPSYGENNNPYNSHARHDIVRRRSNQQYL